MSESRHKLKEGMVFDDRYKLIHMIGKGGFAEVWKAVDMITNVTIAIKVYASLDDQAFKDLAAEYALMQGLNHPNLLKAEHFDRSQYTPYLVMKYCNGGSLSAHLGQIDGHQLDRIIGDIADGLSYLHSKNMVHQDIKPDNILIEENGEAVTYMLSDFGISSKSRTRLTNSIDAGKLSMTEAYAPPEKFSTKRVDRLPNPKGDIFSLGMTIYEIVTGHLPLGSLAAGRELFYNDIEIDYDIIEDEALRTLVKECMQTNPENRPSAAEIEPMMKRLRASYPVKTVLPSSKKNDEVVEPQPKPQPQPQPAAMPGGAASESSETILPSKHQLVETETGGHEQRMTRHFNDPVQHGVPQVGGYGGNTPGGRGPIRPRKTGMSSSMKLTLVSAATFVVVMIIAAVFFFVNREPRRSAPAKTEVVEPLSEEDISIDVSEKSTPSSKKSLDGPLGYDTEGINPHFVEVLSTTSSSLSDVRKIVNANPTYSGMSSSDRETIRTFAKNSNYLINNVINGLFPTKPGEPGVKNEKARNTVEAIKRVYEHVHAKYATEWTEIIQ